jgi:hypothetical protein
MSPGKEPIDTHGIEELAATDALLDRVGARLPSAADLDDPLVAALALMAAEIDLDAVPLDETRSALAAAAPDVGMRPGAPQTHDEGTGLVIDLRGAGGVPDPGPAQVREHSAVGGDVPLRRPSGRGRRPEPGPTAMAPPRSLSRRPSTRPGEGRPGQAGRAGRPSGPGQPGERRERKLRPMTAVAVAIAAIVLGSGVSAALTGGRSVNPLTGIQQVVSVITGHRTQAQLAAYQAAQRQLAAAGKEVAAGHVEKAQALLDAIDTTDLRPEDARIVHERIDALRKAAGG